MSEPESAPVETPEVPAETPPERVLPLLPLRNAVVFPTTFVPLSVGRPGSVAAVEAALAAEGKELLLVAQRPGVDDPAGGDDLYRVGTRAVIKKMARNEDVLEVIFQGVERVRLERVESEGGMLRGAFTVVPLPDDTDAEVEALQRAILDMAQEGMEQAQPEGLPNIRQILASAADPIRLVFLLGTMLSLDVEKEQALLESSTQLDALRRMHEYLGHELRVLALRQKINAQAQSELSREQRDYVLRRQMRAIQDELGEQTPEKAEVDALRRRFEEADLPEQVRKDTARDLARLERLPAQAPDYQVTRAYLELVVELPWTKITPDNLDLPHARRVLDEDHFGLGDVKDRILEHLAVLKLNPGARAPILCLVGPPGVGKTSLGQSVARALGRKFERMSLGGLHDESELRGHRRTYIGAMPGRIVQAIRRAGVRNPLLLLDEVDKLGRDYRGDPASALLEILDPAQNHTFRDNYLDLPFDLSGVFFLATANDLSTLPRPLLDRMEILRLGGYSEDEKLQIARRYLLPRVRTDAGLGEPQLEVPDDTLRAVISGYTREAGCRQLERSLGRLARKRALQVSSNEDYPAGPLTPQQLPDLLGPPAFLPDPALRELPPGVATGLAYTEAGGDVLYVEATLLPESRGLRLTGQLGDVMRESAKAARSYVWANATALGVDPARLRTTGVHVHVPAGAVPKDGPSAGVALVSALVSAYRGTPVRPDTAMTGEITLSGRVLPIGGVREKVLAARRAGVRRVILPRGNEKDLRDLPPGVRDEIEVVLAGDVAEVIAAVMG